MSFGDVRVGAPLRGLVLVVCASICAEGFSASFGPLTVVWAPPADGLVTLNVTYDGSVGAGAWFAWGTSSSFGMVGGDVTVCQPSLSTDAVSQYILTATSSSGVARVSTSPLLASAGCAGGGASFSVTRSVSAGAYAGALPLAGDMRVIWAVGPTGGSGTGVGTVNLVSGAFSSASSLMLEAHGAMMVIAWGVLAPFGVLAARYGKRVRPGPPPLWFVAHRAIQVVALLASLAGFCIAVAAVWGGAHFSSPHAALGLAVFLLGALQALNAVLRPHPAKAGERKPCLRVAWEVLHRSSGAALLVLGAVNVFLGLLLYGTGGGLIAAYAIFIAFLVAVAVWREVVEATARKRVAGLTQAPVDDGPPGVRAQ